jgi:hypothetical protein
MAIYASYRRGGMADPTMYELYRIESYVLGLLEARRLTLLVKSNDGKERFLSLWII